MNSEVHRIASTVTGDVLVVDDEPLNRKLLLDLLNVHGHTTREASNGAQAMQNLESRIPDVVLLDVMLPDFNGFDICQRIKSNPATAQVAILLITALYERSDRLRGIEAGADDFLTKPIDSEEIILRVRNAIAVKRLREQSLRDAALRASEARFRALIEYSKDMVLVLDPDGAIRYTSPSVTNVMGYSPEQLQGRIVFELIHPEDVSRIQAEFIERIQAPDTGDAVAEARIRHADGLWHLHEARGTNLLGNPAVAGFVMNTRDITERRRAEEALRNSEARFRSLIESAPTAIGLSRAVMVLYTNAAFLRMFGYETADELVGRSLVDLNAPEVWDELLQRLRHREAGESVPNEFDSVGLRKDGSRFPYHVAIARVNLDDGPVNVSFFSDLTARKHAEQQAQRQMETLTTLYQGAQQLADNLDLQKLAIDVVHSCVESYGASRAWISLAESDGSLTSLAQFPVTVTYSRQIDSLARNTSIEHSPARRAIHTGLPVIAPDSATDPELDSWCKVALQDGQQCAAAFPLTSRHQTFGALMLFSQQARFFNPERVEFFQNYALQVAAALENARLFEETERRLGAVQALRKVDMAIASSFDLRTTLDIILDQAITQLNVHAASILLLDSHTRMLSYTAGRGFRTRTIQEHRLRLGEGMAGRAALEQRTISSDDDRIVHMAQAEPRYLALASSEGFVAYLATPLVVKGQVRGVLEIFQRVPLHFDTEWQEFLETLARQAAISIDNTTLFEGLQRSNDELVLAYEATIEGWSRALDLRDKETEGHTQRVADVAVELARALDMPASDIVHFRRGALLHDIGKVAVPDNILLKPGPLSEAEWQVMRQHPTLAHDLLSPIQFLRPALDIPYCHHEKWDGSGYPRGLQGEAIPLAARIFAVVDVWDALRSDRPYRLAWPDTQVHDYIQSLSGSHFDPQVVEAFFRLMA